MAAKCLGIDPVVLGWWAGCGKGPGHGVGGVTLEIMHPKTSGGRWELVEVVVSLVTRLVGWLSGMRAVEAGRRLLVGSGQCRGGECVG